MNITQLTALRRWALFPSPLQNNTMKEEVSEVRQIQLQGSKAQYERLKLLVDDNPFGTKIHPDLTTPFLVSWVNRRGVINFKNTEIAAVNAADAVLEVRDDYPEELDYALLQALSRAVEFTDQLARQIKDEKGHSPVSDQPQEPFSLQGWAPEQIVRASYGMAALSSYIIPVPFTPGIRFPRRVEFNIRRAPFTVGPRSPFAHRKRISISFQREDEDLVYQPSRWGGVYIKEEAFKALLVQGLAHWERNIDAERINENCHAVLEHAAMDKVSINKMWQTMAEEKQPRFNLRASSWVRDLITTSEGDFTYRGIPVGGVVDWGEKEARLFPSAALSGGDLVLMKRAMDVMHMRVRVEMMSLTPADFPAVDADKLRELVRGEVHANEP